MTRIGVRTALLVAFLIASGAPVALFWIWPHSAALKTQYADVEERHLLHAKNAATSLQRYYRQVVMAFSTTADLLTDGKDADFARDLLRPLHFRHVCVADWATGKVELAFLDEVASCPDTIPPGRLTMLKALANGETGQISRVSAPNDGGEPRLFLATRRQDKLVVGAITNQFFREIAEAISFGEGGHAAIVDGAGRVISHPNSAWVTGAYYLGEIEPVEQMISGVSGISTFISPALNAEVIAGFSVVPEAGWGVMVPQPLSELQAKADRIAEGATLVLMLGLAFSTVLALVFSEQMASCIGSVSNAAMQMAKGEAGIRVPVRACSKLLIEFWKLRESFNMMAQRVEDSHKKVATLASTDRLTGLVNREAFGEEARKAFEGLERDDSEFVLFFVDLDHFKSINDTYGHGTGDAVLQSIAQTLLETVADGDIVARQSGDEFVVLRRGNHFETIAEFGHRLLNALRVPVTVDGQSIRVSCSIGAAIWTGDVSTLSCLISDADHAMYDVKQHGGDSLKVFDAAMRQRLRSKDRMKRALKQALETAQIDTVFQPIHRLKDNGLSGFEALARWKNPILGQVPPEDFVNLAEETGMIAELGRQVRRRAFAFGESLAKQGNAVPVSINVSQIELARGSFIAELDADLATTSLSHNAIVLEITETQFDRLGGSKLEVLTALRAKGVRLALDDFGKGATTHSQLLNYPLDALKIDLAFPGKTVTHQQSRAVIKSLVELGQCLNMKVTVEGVETAAQQAFVCEIGADDVQGFWHQRPMDANAALEYAKCFLKSELHLAV